MSDFNAECKISIRGNLIALFVVTESIINNKQKFAFLFKGNLLSNWTLIATILVVSLICLIIIATVIMSCKRVAKNDNFRHAPL